MKTILWDNDGVLVHTEPLYLEANRTVLKPIGIDLTDELYHEISLRQGGSVFELALKQGHSQEKVKRLREERDQIYASLIQTKTTVRKGMRQCLETFKSKVQMGIVSSSQPQHFDLIHQKTGLRPLFQFVLTREGFNQPKPHPEPYLTALEKWKLEPTECIVVEDTERGVVSAAEAGLECLAFPHELSRQGDFSRAKKICQSADEVRRELLIWTQDT